jgi:hypothetical protein
VGGSYREKKNRPIKIFSPDFQQKNDFSLFNKIRACKKERLERDVIQMDVENPDSGEDGESIMGE